MHNIYLLSFVPVFIFTFVLWMEIRKRKNFGNRPKYLLRSIIVVCLNALFLLPIIFRSFKPSFAFSIFYFSLSGILYFTAFFLLEQSIHHQRIEKSFLTDHFKQSLRLVYFCYSIVIVVILFLLVAGITGLNIVSERNGISSFLYIVCLIDLIILCVYTNISVFRVLEGVLRQKMYPFYSLLVIYLYMSILFLTHGDFSLNIPVYPLLLLNVIYMIRGYKEYFFSRAIHLNDIIKRQEEAKRASAQLIKTVMISQQEEEVQVIRLTVKNALEAAIQALFVTEHRITGVTVFRRIGDIFKVESPQLIMEYCTPLTEKLNIKRMNREHFMLHLINHPFDICKIEENDLEKLDGFGERCIKEMLARNNRIIMDDLPPSYRSMQQLVAFFPIGSSDYISGFLAIYKDGFNKIFPAEETIIKDLTENLNTIFSMISGKEIQREHNRLAGEMNIAKNIQTSILPREIRLNGYDIAFKMVTATEVGGDAYDFLHYDSGNYFAIGDVSGHGLPSGIMALIQMTAFHGALEAAAALDAKIELPDLYDVVNRVLCRINRDRIGSDKFMTANYFRENNGTFQHAGTHEIALKYSRQEDRVIKLSDCVDKTAFLGLSEIVESKRSAGSFTLMDGDILVLYTDGAIEAKDEKSVQFGVDRLAAEIKAGKDLKVTDLIEKFMEKLNLYAERGDRKKYKGNFADDISFLVIKKE